MKPERERRTTLIPLRVNEAERLKIERLKKSTGLTFADIIRHRVLDTGATVGSEFHVAIDKAILKSVREVLKLSGRGHRTEAEWKAVLSERVLQNTSKVIVDHAMAEVELEEKYRRKRSA